MWESNRDQKSCKICLDLHGSRYYYKPIGRQKHVDQLPNHPVHPNCRCGGQPLIDYAAIIEEFDEWGGEFSPDSGGKPFEHFAGLSPEYFKGGYRMFGFTFGNDGRSVFDGPTYGNFGGGNWTGGRNPEKGEGASEHIDDMDEIFKKHDDAYKKCGRPKSSQARYDCRRKADRRLARDLKKLKREKPDPNDWGGPIKSKIEVEYARRYRDWAIWAFSDHWGQGNDNIQK